MNEPDILTDLMMLADGSWNFTSQEHDVLRRARNEIVALREKLGPDALREVDNAYGDGIKAGRAEALEEAATVCRLLGKGGNLETALACAAAIRALK